MKLGRFSIFAEAKPQRKPRLDDEQGGTGTTIFGGMIAEEYNTDLRGSKGLAIYDKMRRSDGQVQAALLACTLPLRSATWTIAPASDDQTDVEIAEFVEANLMDGMTITWDDFLRHVLLMLPFGFMVFEKVWEVRDGKYCWRKLAPRLPKSISKWQFDEEGGIAAVEQTFFKNEVYTTVPIPIDKLLIFTNDREGSNYEGTSILRAAYKHWYYKDNLYRIDGIAAERHGLGIPVFTHPPNISESDKTKLDNIGRRLHAHQQQYVRLPNDYEFEFKGLGSGSTRDLMPSIQHHDQQIARSILAQFLSLGSGQTGSWALSEDQSSFFILSLKSIANNICDVINRYAIPQLVDYNFEVTEYPNLEVSKLDTRDIQKLSQAVSQLVTSGTIRPYKDLQDALMDYMNLPAPPEEEEQPAGNEPPPPADTGAAPIENAEGEAAKKRPLTEAEQCVSFAEIDSRLDTGVNDFTRAAKALQTKQVEKLADVVIKMIEKKQIDKLDDLSAPYKDEVAGAIETVLGDLFDYGKDQVRKELDRQKGRARKLAEPWPEPLGASEVDLIKKFLKARAAATSAMLGTKLKSAATWEALRQFKAGIIDRQALIAVLTGLSDREISNAAQNSVSEAFNLGRSAEAEIHKDEFDRAIYSAILDENDCRVCRGMDGKQWPMSAPEVAKYAGGNTECQGGGRCRCLLVYVSKAESQAAR